MVAPPLAHKTVHLHKATQDSGDTGGVHTHTHTKLQPVTSSPRYRVTFLPLDPRLGGGVGAARRLAGGGGARRRWLVGVGSDPPAYAPPVAADDGGGRADAALALYALVGA